MSVKLVCSKPFSLLIALVLAFYPSLSAAESLVPNGTCQIIVSTHSSINQARQAASRANFSIQRNEDLKIFETTGGEFSVSIRNVFSSEAPHALRELILGGEAPEAECKSGASFTRIFDAINNVPAEPDVPRGPFRARNGQCYVELASMQTEIEAARYVDAQTRLNIDDLDVFQTSSGRFAITRGTISTNRFEALKGRTVPASAFCSDGNDYTSIVQDFCSREPVQCGGGHEVTLSNCSVDTALKTINSLTLLSTNPAPNGFVSAENAFCYVPDGFSAQDLVVTSFRGGDVDAGDYNFEGYTAQEDFRINIDTTTNEVNFGWTVERPRPPPSSSGSGFFSNIQISRADAEKNALEFCYSYWVNSWPDHGYTHCVIDYCSEYDGSWNCEAEHKR